MREQIINQFLSSGGSICPFSRSADIFYLSNSKLRFSTARKVVEAVLNDQVIILYCDDEGKNFEEAREWTHNTYVRLYELFNRISGTPPIESYLISKEINKSFKDDYEMRSFLNAKGTFLFTIGMGPQYPKNHTRYSPVLMLVITNGETVVKTPKHMIDKIRKEMETRLCPYDADEIWLEIIPKPASSCPKKIILPKGGEGL